MNHEDARGQQEAWVALWKVECQAKVINVGGFAESYKILALRR